MYLAQPHISSQRVAITVQSYDISCAGDWLYLWGTAPLTSPICGTVASNGYTGLSACSGGQPQPINVQFVTNKDGNAGKGFCISVYLTQQICP